MTQAGETLEKKLREAGEAELYELVVEHLDDLEPGAVGQALRNPFASGRVLEVVATRRRLLTSYEVRKAVVYHPRTPTARALNLIGTLYWRDLMRLGADSRVPPRVRRAADFRLAQRLPALSLGEKTAIARSAGPGVIERLRRDPSPRVIGALLENPRMTEALLAPMLASESTPGPVLARVAADRRWSSRHSVRRAIAGNPATPEGVALGLLPGLMKRELAELAADSRLRPAVRRRADLLRGASPVDRDGSAE